jgi:hypothetical protein
MLSQFSIIDAFLIVAFLAYKHTIVVVVLAINDKHTLPVNIPKEAYPIWSTVL